MVFLKKLMPAIVLAYLVPVLPANAQDPLVKAFSESYSAEARKEYGKAIDILQKSYAEDGYEINLRMGWLHFSSGKLDESVRYYKKAVSLKPYAIEPKLGLAQPLAAQGKIDELLGLYQAILAIDPQNSLVNYRVGLIYYNRSQFEKALPYLEKVVNLYPFDYDGLILLAWNQLKLQRVKEARVLFQKALLYKPGDASASEGLKLLQ